MIQIDLILCQPRHIDYPWFRFNLEWIEKYFNKVFIVITQGLEPDISGWFTQTKEYKNVRFVKQPPTDGKTDWRNLAIREVLTNFSKAQYVLFMEQDFLIKNKDNLFEFITKYEKPFLGYLEGERVHPAFAFVKRELIDKTSKDFSANPPLYDHFGKFFMELKEMVEFRFIDQFGFEKKLHWYHIAGLTNNYHCYNLKQPFCRSEEFITYNDCCLDLPIAQNPNFLLLQQNIQRDYGKGDIKFIKSFFPERGVK